jgi:uncharacterized protein YqeY
MVVHSLFFVSSETKIYECNRLDVLRGILAETTNQSKTSSKPLSSDGQILSILRKRAKAAEDAAAGFKAAKRVDLTEKEMSQLGVLEEYINGVETVGEEEIRKIAAEVIGQRRLDGLPVTKGNVLKALKGPNGAFGDRNVEMGTVAQIVEGMV